MHTKVLDKIQELEEVALLSKHEQLVNGIINAIDEKILVQGTMLPSVNFMVKELGFARKTIVKAYNELKERGIVESKNRLGYFIANESTELKMKVAVLLYAFHPFQEIFYNTLREHLGDQYQLDVFFHHNNIEVYETVLNNIIGRYGMYVVAPIHHQKTQELLCKIPESRLLVVDRFEYIDNEYSYISQEFEKSTYSILLKLKEEICQFEEFVLFFKEDSDYPEGTKLAFEQFVQSFHLNGRVEDRYKKGSVKKNCVYLTIGDIDLWGLLKDCTAHNLEIGKDVGILSCNDTPVKEIICGGITTFFVDFENMAMQAAEYVQDRNLVQEIMPVKLVRRKSL